MELSQDKLGHMAAGLLASVACALLWSVLSALGLAPFEGIGAAMFLGGVVAGVVKEVVDHQSNAISPGLHTVDPLDALATAAPGLALFLVDLLVRASGYA